MTTKPLRQRLGDFLLTLLAVAGGICILLVILAFTMKISIMMFRTGSMEPTIPTGSIALVREIPATQMSAGDVITVDRGEDRLPVTHRVVEITDVDEATGTVTFIMRGDANETDDPEPYVADTVQRAFFSIPGVAPVIQYFQHPLVLGSLTIGATILVVWAFWPRDHAPTRRSQRGTHTAQGYLLPVVFALTGSMLWGHNITTEQIQGDYIQLRTSGNFEQMANLAPGQPTTWTVDIWVEATEAGLVDLELTASGTLAEHPEALTTEITICAPHPTKFAECAAESVIDRHLIDTAALARQDGVHSLGTMGANETRRVLVTATLAESPSETIQQTTASFRLLATGQHEQLSATTDPSETDARSEDDQSSLARSGFSSLWWLATALLLILSGGLLRRAYRSDRSITARGTFDAHE